MVMEISATQLNIRTTDTILHELDSVVKNGLFRNRTEAVNEAIRLLIRRYRVMELSTKIDMIAQSNFGEGTLTEALKAVREEEDIR